jgi:hypothetical protein
MAVYEAGRYYVALCVDHLLGRILYSPNTCYSPALNREIGTVTR